MKKKRVHVLENVWKHFEYEWSRVSVER